MRNNILECPIATLTMKGIQLRKKNLIEFHWIRGIPTSFRGSPFVLFASIMLKWLFFSNKQYRPHHQSEELSLDWEMWDYRGGDSLLVDSPLFSSFLLQCCGSMERTIWKKTTWKSFSQQNILDYYGRSFQGKKDHLQSINVLEEHLLQDPPEIMQHKCNVEPQTWEICRLSWS